MIKPTHAAELEALKFPNGYIYVIDESYKNRDEVPPDAILGAWKVNADGKIVGDFIKNENYKSEKKVNSLSTLIYNNIFKR